jgi:hypothetical protein
MNQCASFLGLQLPSLKARAALLNLPRRTSSSTEAAVRGRDQMVCIDFSKVSLARSPAAMDDDTASTMSSSSDSSVTSSCDSSSVKFAEQLVTHVYERPATTSAQKHILFYSDLDYRQFRRDYSHFRRNRTSTVKFACELVSGIYEYADEGRKDDLFYTESDLQR